MQTRQVLRTILTLGLVLAAFTGASGVSAQGGPDQIVIQAENFMPGDIVYDQARDLFWIANSVDGSIYSLAVDGTLTQAIAAVQGMFVQSLYLDAATDNLVVVASDQRGGGFGGGPMNGAPGQGMPGMSPDGTPQPGQEPPADTPQPGQVPEGVPTLDPNFNPSTSVFVYSLTTGEQLRAIDLTGIVSGSHMGGEAALDAAENIYVTDALGGVIYMIDPTDSVFYLDASVFGSEALGLNDIVYHTDGYLLVTQNGQQALWKVPLNDTTQTAQVVLPDTVTGVRSMMMDAAGNLVVLTGDQGGGASLVTLGSSDGWASATVLGQVELESMGRSGVMRGSDVYVLSGGFPGGGPGGAPNATPVQPDPNATPAQTALIRVGSAQ